MRMRRPVYKSKACLYRLLGTASTFLRRNYKHSAGKGRVRTGRFGLNKRHSAAIMGTTLEVRHDNRPEKDSFEQLAPQTGGHFDGVLQGGRCPFGILTAR